MIEKLYTVEEVAELASVTGRTIRNYLKSGRLVGRKIGGQWRFPESEVQRLLTGGGTAPGEAQDAISGMDTGPEYQEYSGSTDYTGSTGGEMATSGTLPGSAAQPREAGIGSYVQPATQAPMYNPAQNPFSAPIVEPMYAQPGVQGSMPLYAQPQQVPVQGGYPLPTGIEGVPVYTQGVPPGAGIEPMYPYTAPVPVPQAVPPSPSAGYAQGVVPAQGIPTQATPTQQPVASTLPQQAAPQPTYQAPVYPEAPAETHAGPASPEPTAAPATPPAGEAEQPEGSAVLMPEQPPLSVLSAVGQKVLQYTAEVHDCSMGPQVCAIVELNQSLELAKATSERLSDIARQEGESGIFCQSFVEYDERYFVARYTLFGSSNFLQRCLKLLG